MQWWAHEAFEQGGVVLLFSWVFWVIGSIVLHELAHGWAAIANGDGTPRETGHMTLNPIVHMGWMSLAMFAILGLAWGLMPTNPDRYRHERRGRVLVAAAGPAMNVLLAVLALTGAGAWAWAVNTGRVSPAPHTAHNVDLFLRLGGFLNLMLAAFNLLPVPPLDGSRILAGASRTMDRFYAQPAVAAYGMLVVLFLFFGTVELPLQRALARQANAYSSWVERSLGGPSYEAAPVAPDDDIPDEGADNTAPATMPSMH